jgi:hypothetical protein
MIPKPKAHVPEAIRVSKETHLGPTIYIPYCNKDGCQWIGDLHNNWAAANEEGMNHLAEIQRLGAEAKRLREIRLRRELPPPSPSQVA